MTKQIDELVRLSELPWRAATPGSKASDEYREAFRTALEAALKPVDKVAALQAIVDSNTGFKRDAAPPAQTPPRPTKKPNEINDLVAKSTVLGPPPTPAQTPPPRLTDVEMLKHRPFWSLKFTDDAILEITRAIETAVRKQFLGRDE